MGSEDDLLMPLQEESLHLRNSGHNTLLSKVLRGGRSSGTT